jgi:D-3-phosphoglycerate dehydrogenase
MFHIVVSDSMAEEGLAALRADDVRLTAPGKMAREEILEAIVDADALIVRSGTQADRELIERAEALNFIGRAGVGVDNIDLVAATERGVIVMNAPSANTVATAEHAFALMLALMRHVPQGHASLAGGQWERKQYMGFELRGKTLGVVGIGRIGREVGIRAQAFEMQVVSYDPFVPDKTTRKFGFDPVEQLDDLLAQSDVVTLHALVTPETKGMINAESIATMKDGARLVNVARGALVDEGALVAALDSGKLAGAALDVYAQEPPGEGNPLVGHPKVVHTPHLAASTAEAQSLVSILIAEQVLEALRGGEPRDVVNPEVLAAKE